MHTRQAGVSGAAILVVLVLVALALLAARGLTRSEVNSEGELATRERIQRISDALVSFANSSGRLPCPAIGTSDSGDEDPLPITSTCTDSAGVIPWKTLGIRRDESVDGWGRKFSYRVYSGATGLTQPNGASASNCNSLITTSCAALISGLCGASHKVSYATFLSGKGISVNDRGVLKAGIGFVVISHGESGYGGYQASGGGRVTPRTDGSQEASNSNGVAPFYASARSVANLTPSDLAYFDDIVAYKSIDEIVNESKLAARPWDANACDSVSAETFTRTNISAAVGSAVGNNTGQNSVTFRAGTDGQFTATAFGSASRNISSGIGTSGEGIGTIATGSSTSTATTVNSGSNEFLRFQFLNPGRSLGITLVDFGNLSSGPLHFERVQFRFLLASVQVGSTVTKSACKTGPVQANYSVDPGGLFDEVEVRPVSTLASENSALLVGSIRTCGVGVAPAACFAPTRVASNDCP